jgi:hypothetical protein
MEKGVNLKMGLGRLPLLSLLYLFNGLEGQRWKRLKSRYCNAHGARGDPTFMLNLRFRLSAMTLAHTQTTSISLSPPPSSSVLFCSFSRYQAAVGWWLGPRTRFPSW